MPEEQSGGTSVPAATTTPAVPPPAAATPPAVPQPADESQPWFRDRLERGAQQAREKLLAELGVADPEKAKAAIAAAKAAEEANKTAEQRRAEAEQRATAAEARVAELSRITGEIAAQRLAGLSEAQRAVIATRIGDDAEATVQALDLLDELTKAAKPTTASQVTPPATTAPTTGGPPPVTPTSPPDHTAVYAELKRTNPFAAAGYAQAHPEAYRSRA